MSGAKWSPERRAKYKATIKAKQASKQESKPSKAQMDAWARMRGNKNAAKPHKGKLPRDDAAIYVRQALNEIARTNMWRSKLAALVLLASCALEEGEQ